MLRDIEDQDLGDNLKDQQKQALNNILKGHRDLLGGLNRTLVKYHDIGPTGKDVNVNGVRRVGRWVWKTLICDQKEI